MISNYGILSRDDILTIHEYHKNAGNTLLATKYKDYCIYATGCPMMFEYAQDFIKSPTITNKFYDNLTDAYFTSGYYHYFNGINNIGLAMEYFEKCSKQNCCANYNLASYYSFYNNKQKQHEYLVKSIEDGNVIAISKFVILNNLNYFHDIINPTIDLNVIGLNGQMCWHIANYFENRMDIGNTLLFYKLASDKGIEPAMMKLAKYYQEAKRYNMMIKYYKMLAMQFNSVEAMKELTKFYKERGYYNKMEKYYKKLASMGIVNAYFNLGIHYRNKQRYEINNENRKKKVASFETKMMSAFEKAISLGCHDSPLQLEQYYIEHNMGDRLLDLYENKLANSITEQYQLFASLKKFVGEEFQCPITLNVCKKGLVTECGHVFSCDLLFIKNMVCPMCRAELM
jgi:hypothetical protein